MIRYDNIWIYVYLIYFAVYLLLINAKVLEWKKNTQLRKEKIFTRYLMYALNIGTSLGILGVFILPVFNINNYTFFGTLFNLFYIVILYYSISKLDFMNINYSMVADEIITNIDDMVLLLNPGLKIVNINNKFETLLSVNGNDMKNKAFLEIIDRTSKEEKEIQNFIDGQNGSAYLKIGYKMNSGIIMTDSYLSKIRDKFNDITGYLVISHENKSIKQFMDYFKITKRELELIELVITGLSYKEAADKMGVVEKTIEAHLRNIYNKLGINNKVELIKITGGFNIKA